MLAQLPERTERHYFDTADGVAAFLTGNLLQDGDAVWSKGRTIPRRCLKWQKR